MSSAIASLGRRTRCARRRREMGRPTPHVAGWTRRPRTQPALYHPDHRPDRANPVAEAIWNASAS